MYRLFTGVIKVFITEAETLVNSEKVVFLRT